MSFEGFNELFINSYEPFQVITVVKNQPNNLCLLPIIMENGKVISRKRYPIPQNMTLSKGVKIHSSPSRNFDIYFQESIFLPSGFSKILHKHAPKVQVARWMYGLTVDRKSPLDFLRF